ncbi:unnamed protein product [Owenia fusiformis]|uniref:NADAR domain-containing protein n=1 Tax=Owenia fusiformis TaxID=6347 RepID=A0A8S4PYW1_OWEFU|nr:unnamed protein product [Owenia fusiformis]
MFLASMQAREMAKEIKCTDDWDINNIDIMKQLISEKIQQHPEIKDTLLDTGDTYIAMASFETTWGSGLGQKLTCTTDQEHWPGKNTVGSYLMELRSTLNDEITDISYAQTDVTLAPATTPKHEEVFSDAVEHPSPIRKESTPQRIKSKLRKFRRKRSRDSPEPTSHPPKKPNPLKHFETKIDNSYSPLTYDSDPS